MEKRNLINLIMIDSFVVLFDLNGTLVNTEEAFFTSYKEALSKYNISFTIDDFTNNWSTKGKKLKDFLTDINREDLLLVEKDIMKHKDEVFEKIFEEKSSIMPGAKEAVERIKRNGIPLGLDSSNARHNINRLLIKFGLENMFDAITSFDMELDESRFGAKKKKSSRLKALAEMLNSSPNESVVIGDAEKDIKGAKDAGMKTIAVPSIYTKNNDFSIADKVIKSLDEVNLELIVSLF